MLMSVSYIVCVVGWLDIDVGQLYCLLWSVGCRCQSVILFVVGQLDVDVDLLYCLLLVGCMLMSVSYIVCYWLIAC